MNIQETLQQKLGKEIAQASNEEIYGALLSMVQEMAGEKERTDSKKKLYYIIKYGMCYVKLCGIHIFQFNYILKKN